MRNNKRHILPARLLAVSAFSLAALTSGQAHAQAQVNIICSVQQEWCTSLAAEFQKASGVKVNITQKGSGEAVAQLAAEKANPKLDVWFGGTGDPHLQAAEQGLTEEYKSSELPKLHEWARKQAEQSGYRTVGIYAGALGFGYNTENLTKKKLAAPACWKDLLDPKFKDEIMMANPASSGTAYTAIATLVQLMGEDEAFKYLKGMHKNVASYPKSGTGPIKSVARGEATVSISFVHDAPGEILAGFPVGAGVPCEGTGYEIGSMSIIKGARNLDAAKKFVDWALTPEAQALAAKAKQFQVPSNVATAKSPMMPDLTKMKLINYDFAKYGKSAERRRLIDKWEKEVGSLSK
jgi:iron(III) transport system substrate-binding protein